MAIWNPNLLDASTGVVLYEDGSIACAPVHPGPQAPDLSPHVLLGAGEGAALALLPRGQVFVPGGDRGELVPLSTAHGEPRFREELARRLLSWMALNGSRS